MLPELVMLSHGAVAVGIAQGALADLLELASAGIKQLHRVARARLDAQSAGRWREAQQGAARNMARVVEAQQAAAWITSACVRVADGCFELAGTQAVYESSPPQRRMRDLHVAAQHAAVHQRNYVRAVDAALSRWVADDVVSPRSGRDEG